MKNSENLEKESPKRWRPSKKSPNLFLMCFTWLLFIYIMLPFAGSPASAFQTTLVTDSVLSVPLQRAVRLDIILPPGYSSQSGPYPVLYLNDGQDLPRLQMQDVMDSLYQKAVIRPVVVVAIHAGDRIQEYGTAAQADYMKRGSKAGLYTDFVLTELMPHIQKQYAVSADPGQTAFAGFSLGGLSAFDIVWHHPERFSRAGVFSGSFWWRSKAFSTAYNDYHDRIMHVLVRQTPASDLTGKKSLQFWLQTGTDDETSDRNNNGVIDSIDDTLDIIHELEAKGYRKDQQVRYVEVQGGQHNQETWRAIMPDFLVWAFGR